MSHFWEWQVWDERKASHSQAWTWHEVWKEWISGLLTFSLNGSWWQELEKHIHMLLCIYTSIWTQTSASNLGLKPVYQTFPVCSSPCICWYPQQNGQLQHMGFAARFQLALNFCRQNLQSTACHHSQAVWYQNLLEGPRDEIHSSTLQINWCSTKRKLFAAMDWNKMIDSSTDGQKLVLWISVHPIAEHRSTPFLSRYSFTLQTLNITFVSRILSTIGTTNFSIQND